VAWSQHDGIASSCAKLIHDGFIKNAAKSRATLQGVSALARFSTDNWKAQHKLSATSHLERFLTA
jgi:hypothetical protein